MKEKGTKHTQRVVAAMAVVITVPLLGLFTMVSIMSAIDHTYQIREAVMAYKAKAFASDAQLVKAYSNMREIKRRNPAMRWLLDGDDNEDYKEAQRLVEAMMDTKRN